MMAQKIIIISIIFIAFLIGAIYLLSDQYFNNKTQQETQTPEESGAISSWKNFDNEYLFFVYPPDWILEQLPSGMMKEKAHIRLMSPKQTSGGPPLYTVAIRIYDAAEYVSTLNDDDVRKNEIKKIIQGGDLKAFSDAEKISVNNSFIYNNFEYGEFFKLNGTDAFISFAGNDEVLYGPRITFLPDGNIIQIVVLDISGIPNPYIGELQKEHKNFLRAYDDRIYGKILRSLTVK